MKRFLLGMIVSFCSGLVLGHYLFPREDFIDGVAVQHARIQDPLRQQMLDHGIDAGQHGIEVTVAGWRIYFADAGDKAIMHGGSSVSEMPTFTILQEEGKVTLIGAEDAEAQMSVTTSDDGRFIMQSVQVGELDGKRMVFIDEGFNGFYSRAMSLSEDRMIFGNLSDEEWLPLRKDADSLVAQRGVEWVPVKWESGRLVFDEDQKEKEGAR